MHSFVFKILIAGFLFFSQLVVAQEISLFADRKIEVDLSNKLFLATDKDVDLQGVFELHDQFGNYESVKKTTKDAIWVKFPVKRYGELSSPNWIFEIEEDQLDFVDFYIISPFGDYVQYRSGECNSFQSRPIKSKEICFPVAFEEEGKYWFYIKIMDAEDYNLDFNLYPYNDYLEETAINYHQNGLFLGAVIFILLVMIVQITFYRKLDYLFFLLFLVSVVLLILARDNIGFHLFWNSYPDVNLNLYSFSLLCLIVFEVLFLRKFLDLHYFSTQIDYLLIGLLVVRVILYTTNSYVLVNNLDSVWIDVTTVLYLLIVTIIVQIKKHDLARFVVVGLSVQVVTEILVILRQYSVISNDVLPEMYDEVGILLVTVFFCTAIIDKIRYSNVYIIDEAK